MELRGVFVDILSSYKTGLEQLKRTKTFIQDLNPVDYDLKSIIHTIDAKINSSEQRLTSMQTKSDTHRCGLCDRAYSEEEPKAVGVIKVCPSCRLVGSQFKCGSDLEDIFGLPKGTIKRDCLSKDGKPAKLQAFMDCGLIYKSGVHNIVHEIVIHQYYLNDDVYKPRKRKNDPAAQY